MALGFALARRGFMAAAALLLTLACAAFFALTAFGRARYGHLEALHDVPLVASSALAFGVGVLVAFAASTRTFRRDEDEGIRALLAARGVSPTGYLLARIAGLAATLALFVGGGSALVGAFSVLAARGRVSAVHTLQASAAAVVFAVAFAVTFAPLAMATLGGRSRGGGYLALLAVLVLPEAVAPRLAPYLAPRWVSVASIPGALLAVRDSLARVGFDARLLGRGLLVLAIVIIASVIVVRVELLRSHGGDPAPRPRG